MEYFCPIPDTRNVTQCYSVKTGRVSTIVHHGNATSRGSGADSIRRAVGSTNRAENAWTSTASSTSSTSSCASLDDLEVREINRNRERDHFFVGRKGTAARRASIRLTNQTALLPPHHGLKAKSHNSIAVAGRAASSEDADSGCASEEFRASADKSTPPYPSPPPPPPPPQPAHLRLKVGPPLPLPLSRPPPPPHPPTAPGARFRQAECICISCCSEQRRHRVTTTVRRSMTFNAGMIAGRPPPPPLQPPPPSQTARNPGAAPAAAAMLSRNQSSAAAFKPLVMARRREAQHPSQRSVVTNLVTTNNAPPPPHRSFGGTHLSRSQSQFVAGERRTPRVFQPPPTHAQQRPPPVLRPQQRLPPPPPPPHPRLQQQQQPWYDLSATPSSCSSTASSSETDLRAGAALYRRHEVSRNFSSAGDSKFAPAPLPRAQQRPPRLLSYSSSFCSPMGNVARERQRMASAGAFQGGAAPESVTFQRRKKSVKDCIVS